MNKLPVWLLVVFALTLTACETLPREAFRLSESSLQLRAMQTREYEDVTDIQILSASSALLQDLGYAIDEIEKPLGVLSASKKADASNRGEKIGTRALDTVTCIVSLLRACSAKNFKATDAVQDIRLTLVTIPNHQSDRTISVRITMQRIVWDHENRITKQQTISDPNVYAVLFDKLSKSVFLEQVHMG